MSSVERSLKRTFADFKVFSRGYLRNRFGLFFGLIFPVILILIFGAIFSGTSNSSISVYVQNQDTGPFASPQMNIAQQFINQLNSSGVIKITLVPNSDNFTKYLSSQSASEGIIIPENFSVNYLAGTPVNVIVYSNPTLSTSSAVDQLINGIANYFNLNYYKQNAKPIIGITQATVSPHQTKYIDFLVPGLIGFAILISPMFSLVNISSDYKKTKLFKQLSLTPLTKMEWLASKILWYIVLSVISFFLMVAVGIYLYGASITLTPWLIPFLLIGPTLFAALGMLVGTVTKSPETAGVIGNVVTFPMMFLSGTFFPISIMPAYLQTLAHVFPLFYIIEGLNNVMVYSNYTGAILDLAVTALITVVIFVAAVRLFKWRED